MSIPLTIDSLKGGGAVERLHKALQEALDNIMDPNTLPKKSRTVTLKLTITANEERTLADMTISTDVKTQAPKPLETKVILDKDKHGRAVGSELMVGEAPGSRPLPGMHPDGRITVIKTAKEA
ncbi:MAG: hypothetical protein LBB40_01670, partial [Holophagales bacterium]|jgi:hypothetical protein|nr:hypothetical protein [Holophagales bacterium]